MKINRNNYEIFIIDYFDGKLNAETQSELMLFLNENPDLKEEFELSCQTLLQPDPIIFEKKELLKKKIITEFKGISELNYENYFIAYFESDLDKEQTGYLKIFLELNQSLKSEFELFGQLQQKPDQAIIFSEKDSLKKESDKSIVYFFVAAAAIFTLFFTLYPIIFREVEVVAQFEKPVLSILVPKNIVNDLKPELKAEIITSKKIEINHEIKDEISEKSRDFEKLISLESRNVDQIANNPADFARPIVPEQSEIAFESEQRSDQTKKRSALGRIFDKNISGLIAIFNSGNKQELNDKDPVFVKVIDQSLVVFNTVTGSEAALTKVYDNKGNLLSYGIEGETINVSRNLNHPSN